MDILPGPLNVLSPSSLACPLSGEEGGSFDLFDEKLRKAETCLADSSQELAEEDVDRAGVPSLAAALISIPWALGPRLKDPSSSSACFLLVFPSPPVLFCL